MYEQLGKQNNKGRNFISSIAQNKSNANQAFRYTDNRLEAFSKITLKGMENKSELGSYYNSRNPIQRRYIPPHRRGVVAPAPLTPNQRRINAVQAALAAPGAVLPAAAGPGILVFHPPTPAAPWEYTRTVQYTIPVPGLPAVIVRGHIHYTNTTGVVGPGNMWIDGVVGYAFPTPAAVVANFNAMPGAVARGLAVHSYNTAHGSTHNTL